MKQADSLIRFDRVWFDDPCSDSLYEIFVLFRAASCCRAGSDGEALAVPDSKPPVSRCKFENLGQDSQEMTRHDEAPVLLQLHVICNYSIIIGFIRKRG